MRSALPISLQMYEMIALLLEIGILIIIVHYFHRIYRFSQATAYFRYSGGASLDRYSSQPSFFNVFKRTIASALVYVSLAGEYIDCTIML